tara:strand:+ start:84 stop:494 length:411 start_codon:yes stop_codon:yes gene_type:complete
MPCQIFSFADPDQEVIPEGLYMSTVVGDALSVGVVSVRQKAGSNIPQKAHAHGEEMTLQITGGCTVDIGPDVAAPEDSLALEAGTVMVMPKDVHHSGRNRFDAGGLCLWLNVVTPPRAEYGQKGQAKAFYPQGDKA